MKRISGYIPDELYSDIEELCKRENRKIAPMITMLLQLAVKEKTRKRNAKKIHISDHATDEHQNNAGGQGVFPHTKR